MAFKWKTQKPATHYLGYRAEIMPIIQKAMADFVLRMSINSSYVVLGMLDIASEGFYKHDVKEFIDQIPEHISYYDHFSPYIKPYVSPSFKNKVYGDAHELLIGAFFKYFIIRLPALIHHGRFGDWPANKGVSEDDLSKIAFFSIAKFEEYFPNAFEQNEGKCLYNRKNLICDYAGGMEITNQHLLADTEMQKFLYSSDEILTDVLRIFPELEKRLNVLWFFADCFSHNFKIFWNGYRADYMETLRDWSYSGAFVGEELKFGFSFDFFWNDLEQRLNRLDFIIRTSGDF